MSHSSSPRSTPSHAISKKDKQKSFNKVTISSGITLEGDELEDYCKRRGLCPLCAKTRTRKRVFKLLKRNKWEALTLFDREGKYIVYKGYCVKPNCFSLVQAKRLAGDPVGPSKSSLRHPNSPQRRSIRKRSVMKGQDFHDSDSMSHIHEGSNRALGGDAGTNGAKKRNVEVFPPAELRNISNFECHPDQPNFVIQKAVEGLRQDSNLISIMDLSGIELRTPDYEALSDALRVNTTLTSLTMENTRLDDDHLAILAAGLDDAKDIPLVKLYLRNNQITDVGIDKLCPFFQANENLEKIDISRNNISSQGGLAVFSAFHRNRLTRIRCINFSHNALWDISDNEFGIEVFLRRNRTLRILNLEGNHLNDESVQALARGIKDNDQTVMERLYLGWNSIGDDGTIALAQMLESNATLAVLGLGENQIQNAGARALLAAMEVNTTIKEISGLWRNMINRRFIIIAIRRLLLSMENSDGVRAKLHEQAPSNTSRRRISANDTLLENTAMNGRTLEDKETGKAQVVERKVVSPEEVIESRPRLDSVSETTVSTFDQITIFRASPLVYFDRETELHRAIPLVDTAYETEIIEEALSQVTGGHVDVNVEVATVDRFSSFFAESGSHIMHFSSSCQKGSLGLENGFGFLQTLPADGLRRLMEAVDSNLQVAFISSRYAESIGRVFVDAGVPHVVCCELDDNYRDAVGMEFIRHFYTGLATKKTLRDAYGKALSALSSSSIARHVRRMNNRFLLLPEKPDSDPYHNIQVFFSHEIPRSIQEANTRPEFQLPEVPEFFLGREVIMYEILEALRVDDVVRISGPPGAGKDSVVAAVCRYALDRRNTFAVDNMFWLPAPEGIVPDEDSLYGDLCLCTNILKDAKSDVWDTDELLLECRDRIEVELEELQVVLVVDERQISSRGAQEGIEKFVSYLLNVANAKIILLTSKGVDTVSTISQISALTSGSHIEEASIEIQPLDFKSTARLFGSISKFITNSGCPAAHNAVEFADLLEPAFISKMRDTSGISSQRRSDLFARLGNGHPADVVSTALNMPKEHFISLINIANSPEIFVDSLGALEGEIRRRTIQRGKAIKEKNFLRAMDLDAMLEELEEMRPEFPTIEDLKEEEELMRSDLEEAVRNRRYDKANDLKREIVVLKKRILKEKRMHSDVSADQEANEQLDAFQAHVQTIMQEARNSTSVRSLNGSERAISFAINCDTRDCDFTIYVGNVEEFDHPAEAKGIVCWSNESCDLGGTMRGDRLLELGGPALVEDLALPIVKKSDYGPIRCGTGNAVFVGPSEYGKLSVPCLIMAVGPLSPRSLEDAKTTEDNDDTLHYITNMLRSSYRSSIVLARHAELQALGISLLTTRRSGQAYEETLRIGIQTLVEEVKFSQLRDLHIMAASWEEVTAIAEVLTELGHRRV